MEEIAGDDHGVRVSGDDAVDGASEGLGYLLIDGQQLGKPAEIVAAILAFSVLAKLTDWMIVVATAPLLRWEDRARGAEA